MRVAVVAESFLPTVNGVTNSICRVLEHLERRGDEALVIAPGPAPESYAGAPVREVTAFSYRQFPVGLPTAHVQQVLEDFAPDVVHVAAPFVLGAYGLTACERLDLPTVAVYQTDMAGFAARHGFTLASRGVWRWLRRVHEMADMTLAPSRSAMADLRAHRVPRVRLWGRGVDTERFRPSRREGEAARALRARLAPDGEVLVGYVGRLFPEKRVERLAVLAGLPGVRVVLGGDGPSRAALERLFEERGLPAAFLGHLDGDDLADAYAALDVFVHTGTEETFGQTLQEAMASRLPVVAPDVGGPRDIVQHGVTGYRYAGEDDRGLRRQVAVLAGDAALRERMGEAGRRAVRTRSWEAVCDQLLGYYDEARAAHPTTPRRQVVDLSAVAGAELFQR
ncbi:glycosyltransferase family 4 protein [Aquipuribacter sp. SD81]|uniref:glycosyltransferase family 4 protein n=1 Tax=Aquipuribacter sp. SD81 TaxID=3127703 RepID=UPI00301B5DC8